MIYLIDADTMAYACSAVTEGTSPNLARWEINSFVERLLNELGATDYQLYITGEGNFRHQIYPEYKATRLKVAKPTFLELCKQHLVDEWDANVAVGYEADDMIGFTHYKYREQDMESVVVSIDKDLDQLAGWHYNPGIKRDGVYIKAPRRYVVSPAEAIRFFYYQLLVGDSTDNIKGAVGIGPKKAEKILAGLSTESELYAAVKDYYGSDEELNMNAQVLWIWKKENDMWHLPTIDTNNS